MQPLSDAPAILWFRRDLRLSDHPALEAAATAGPVVPLFVLDPALLEFSGAPRVAFLLASLRALSRALSLQGATLVVRRGDPAVVVPALTSELGAGSVHVTADFGPYGRERDRRVSEALGDVPLQKSGTPYAVAPDALRTGDGSSFRVYGAFWRAWRRHGWPPPSPTDAARVRWLAHRGEAIPAGPSLPAGLALPAAGEDAALAALELFVAERSAQYASDRDRPDLDATSRLSPYLKFGSIHPRTVLARLQGSPDRFLQELAWREFYASVLSRWPDSAREAFRPALAGLGACLGSPSAAHLEAWKDGRTGYPIVDAGMRQLAREGWMHNRVRMIVASFLVKDLHHDWTTGARHFMRLLVDGDLASNQHNWQWVAGTGSDAAPYFRIFNPITQGKRFDPEGAYIRRYVAELKDVPSAFVHEPWRQPGGRPAGYPAPIVDHREERERSLDAYRALRARASRRP